MLVKREVIAKRPTLTGYVNTDLALVTGRGAYVEDDVYWRFKKALDTLVDDIPDTPHYSNVLVQKSLNKLAKVLEKALTTVEISLPAEYKVVNEQQLASAQFQVGLPAKGKQEGQTDQDYHRNSEIAAGNSRREDCLWNHKRSAAQSLRSSGHDYTGFDHPESVPSSCLAAGNDPRNVP